ncbi:hypothetical protein SKDZ_12G3270 [Saccharomyces kudriavzevii ZP591]|nr:hypothetical protein SKDZ_12G3270 [Saccharomyces kudriavzevii ZP591]
MAEGDFLDEQANVALLGLQSMCNGQHSVKTSIGDEIFKLLIKILNSDEKANGDVDALVSGSSDLSNLNFENEPLENILAVFIISFIIVVVGVLLLGLIGMICISFRTSNNNDKRLQCNDEEKQVLTEKA